MSGPIVRTGATPEFWANWDRVFGDKKKSPAAGPSKKKSGKKNPAKKSPSKKSPKKKTAKKQPAKKTAKKKS